MLLTLLYIVAVPLVAYSVWQISGVFVSLSSVRTEPPSCPQVANGRQEAVALLYPTCNDFSPEACDTLFSQEEVTFHLFILDDSNSPDYQERIDKWVAEKTGSVTIVRRQDRVGFKGGNINHWLMNCREASKYPFFLVVDADEKLPHTFAHSLLSAINADSFAFVQAAHSGRADTATCIQRLCNLQVDCIWFYEVPARQVMGIAPSLGHGVLFSQEAVSSVGGFPPVVSEDLGLTIRLASQGKLGRYVTSVVGYEAFPYSYDAYWRRRRRWIQADAEIVWKFLPSLWRSNVPLAARVDLSLRETRLAVGSLHWVLLTIVSVLALFSPSGYLALPVATHVVALFWLVPVLVSFFLQGPSLLQKMRFVLFAPYLGMASSAINPLASLAGLMGRVNFNPTGMRTGTKNPVAYVLWETVSGLFFLMAGVISGNYFLSAAGLAVASSPLMRTRREVPVLCAGTFGFWALIALQVGLDVANDGTSVLTIAVLVGLTLALA